MGTELDQKSRRNLLLRLIRSGTQADLLESILNNLAEGVVVADLQGRFLFFNPEAARIMGLGPLDIPPDQWSEHYGVFYSDEATPVPSDQLPLARAIRGDSTDDAELFIRNAMVPEGLFISVKGRPLWNAQGDLIGGVVNLRDVTEQRRLQARILKALETSADFYNNAPCGFHSLNEQGVFIRINDTELKWLGYRREEVVGRMKFKDVLTAESLKIFQDNFPRFVERGWVKDLEFDMVRKDGVILPVLLSATAIMDPQGRYLMSRSVVYDMADKKAEEKALHEVLEGLEDGCKAKIQNLIKSNEKLTRDNATLTEMFRNLCKESA